MNDIADSHFYMIILASSLVDQPQEAKVAQSPATVVIETRNNRDLD